MAYLPLSTANLPDPVIDPAQGASPEDYFNTVLTTSTGSTLSVDVGFAADFLWTKARNFGRHHELHDRVRGDNVRLKSSETSAEESYTNYVVFDADGADLGTNHNLGYHAGGTTTGVVWAWKANGSGVSNTDGSITSTVSANTTSGFSIVSYTGTGSNATVGHGLSSAPEMVIVKGRNVASTNWFIYTATQGATKYLDFSTGTGGTDSTSWNNTAPTSSVFSVGSSYYTNYSATTYIAYCFHSVPQYSAFTSYTGNGSSDGVFVYLGFKPAFTLVKRTDSTDDWYLRDANRDIDNPTTQFLEANTSNAEGTGVDIDYLSNGIKIRGTGVNASGGTYIIAAFAEQPFKYSTAR